MWQFSPRNSSKNLLFARSNPLTTISKKIAELFSLLQINTGKLFTRPIERQNAHHGILYTNAALPLARDYILEGEQFGRLTPTTELSRRLRSIVYEFVERIEAPEFGPSVIVSHGADPYLQDMAVVTSLALNCICSPDIEVTKRLTSGQRSLSSGAPPNRYIRRVFEDVIYIEVDEAKRLATFLTRLLGLHRKTYLGVMRAIRTYVTGLHRVADDLELAYTLMVAAGESLAQDFDGYKTAWEHVTESKRLALDRAMKGAPNEFVQRVRDAIVELEHPALARRFQGFIAANVSPDYFCMGFDSGDHPIGRSELPEALSLAYAARSKYVHQLRALPDSITLGHGYYETGIEDRRKMLTLQGLARLVRHVIMTFVERQPVIDKEVYDYRLERAGVVQIRMAPSYWIGHADGDISNAGRDKLEGFLEELATALTQPDKSASNLTNVLSAFSTQAFDMKRERRLPYLALHVIYNAFAGPQRVQTSTRLQKLMEQELRLPSSECLVAHSILGLVPPLSMDEHRDMLRNYRLRRGAKNGVRFPRLFEAAIALDFAERLRVTGEDESCRAAVLDAADDFPECAALRTLADTLQMSSPIQWRDILLPQREPNSQPGEASENLDGSHA